jgi:hypothetical protein
MAWFGGRSHRGRERPRRRYLRLAATLACAGLVLAIAGSVATTPVTTAHSKSVRPSTARYSRYGMSFRYPAGWHVRSAEIYSSVAAWAIWVSPQPLHAWCGGRASGRRNHICRGPLTHLRRNSALVEWSWDGDPTCDSRSRSGRRISVGGLRGGWMFEPAPKSSSGLHANRVIMLWVPIPHRGGNCHEMMAQIRGPATARLTRQVWAMVHSVHWGTSRA